MLSSTIHHMRTARSEIKSFEYQLNQVFQLPYILFIARAYVQAYIHTIHEAHVNQPKYANENA